MKEHKITTINSERKKQILKIGLILAAIFAVIFIMVRFTDNKKNKPVTANDGIADKIKKENFSGTAIETEKDVWISRSEEKIKSLEEENRIINKQIESLTNEIDNLKEIDDPEPVRIPDVRKNNQSSNDLLIQKPDSDRSFNSAPQKGIRKFSFSNNTGIDIQKNMPNKNPLSMSLPEPKIKNKQNESKDDKENNDKDHPDDISKNNNNWLPSGSFMSGVLLSGLDAPTGGQAQTNPHPVLIKITDNAVLPNQFRTKVKECFVTAGGYGDISSERAYIRTESLSCVMKDGKVIDVPLKGYIAGEDGKNGIRGRLVSKEGQLLARSMMAGFASGVSDAFKTSASSFSISPLGAVQTLDPDKMLEAGAYSGAGKAMERLANYYISMAEKVFPIIEIDSGRKVDIVLLKGLSLEVG